MYMETSLNSRDPEPNDSLGHTAILYPLQIVLYVAKYKFLSNSFYVYS